MDIKLDLYRIFYFTARSGSFSKAAKKLFTSQPAVSQSIKQLEEKLSVTLFYRTPRGISLTHDGSILFSYVSKSCGLLEAAEHKLEEMKKLDAGILRIAVCSAICKYDLLNSLKIYRQKYPQIKMEILDTRSGSVAELLNKGKIDIGIMNEHCFEKGSMEQLTSIMLQDCFIAGSKYFALLPAKISLQELARSYPLLALSHGGLTRSYIDGYFKAEGMVFSPQIELSNLDLLVTFTINNMGIAHVVKKYVQKELDDKKLYEINLQEKIPARQLIAAKLGGVPLPFAAAAFMKIFIQIKKANSPAFPRL